MSQSLLNRPTELLGFPVFLWMVGGGEIVFGAGYFACGVEKLGEELLPAVV